MRAERSVELDKARLVEGADQMRRRPRSFARRRRCRGDRRADSRAAVHVREIAACRPDIEDRYRRSKYGAIARGSEPKPAARRRRGKCIIVDREFKLTEMPTSIADAALQDRKLVCVARSHVARLGQKHRDVETIGETRDRPRSPSRRGHRSGRRRGSRASPSRSAAVSSPAAAISAAAFGPAAAASFDHPAVSRMLTKVSAEEVRDLPPLPGTGVLPAYRRR